MTKFDSCFSILKVPGSVGASFYKNSRTPVSKNHSFILIVATMYNCESLSGNFALISYKFLSTSSDIKLTFPKTWRPGSSVPLLKDNLNDCFFTPKSLN